MRLTLLLTLILGSIFQTPLSAQYYFTGEVRDPHGDKLQNVSILVQSTGLLYKTGNEGSFEIVSRKAEDSLLFAIRGYESYATGIHSSDFLQITLKMQSMPPIPKGRLMAAYTGLPSPGVSASGAPGVSGENPFVGQAAQVSFPANINGVSYNTIRRFLDMGTTVPADAVKIEEMLSYFNFYYEEPEAQALFHCSSDLLPCPWSEKHELLYLNICTRITDRQQLPPAHLVYLIDASGSMDMPNKLPLLKSGFRLLVKNLRNIDTVSLVVFGSRVGVALQGVSGTRKGELLSAIEGLRPDGPSPGATGLKLAYQVAKQGFIEGGTNKVILVTDGDISDGATGRQELEEMIREQSKAGIQLTCMGIGIDSVRNSELPWLAEAGHGNFASITDAQEAEKELLNELDRGICTVADSVCITATFDSTLIKEYRLIGFESKPSVLGDSTVRMVGGKISSGHSLMALFELVPKKDSAEIENVARVKIGYSIPGKKTGLEMEYQCPNRRIAFEKTAGDRRKAACIALFGMKLKKSGYTSAIPWADVEKMARKNFSGNNMMDRDYIALVVRARKIYEHDKQN